MAGFSRLTKLSELNFNPESQVFFLRKNLTKI